MLSLRNYLHGMQVCSLHVHGCAACGKINGRNLTPFWLVQGELGIRWTELALEKQEVGGVCSFSGLA